MGSPAKQCEEGITFPCHSALSGAGYIVTTADATAGYVQLTDADYEVPFGVAVMGTKNPIDETMQSGQYIAVQRAGYAFVKLHKANEAIAVGGLVGTMYTVNGVTDQGGVTALTLDPTNTSTYFRAHRSIVGTAMEAVGVSNGGLILVHLATGGI